MHKEADNVISEIVTSTKASNNVLSETLVSTKASNNVVSETLISTKASQYSYKDHSIPNSDYFKLNLMTCVENVNRMNLIDDVTTAGTLGSLS